jgi:mannose-1-phosphate guanylyltransferase/phosphomannomutase
MKAIVFADRNGQELQPLTEKTCVALLPIAGKPLILPTIESLGRAGVRHAFLVVSSHAESLEELLGEGTRWGMQFEYVLARPEEQPEGIIARMRHKLGQEFLVLRGDILRSHMLQTFLTQAANQPDDHCCATINGQSAAMCLVRDGGQQACGRWTFPQVDEARVYGGTPINIPDGVVSLVESFSAYHQANLDVLHGLYPGLVLPGRDFGNGVTRARGSRLSASVPTKRQIFAGAFCYVDQDVEQLEDVVLSDGVIVDKQASVKSSVVFPYSYIGQSVELSNAIVCPPYLIRVDTGSVTRVTDAFLLCDLKRTPVGSWVSNVTNRFLGMVLLLVSAPVWPIALFGTLFTSSSHRIRKLVLIGNLTRRGELGEEQRQEFQTAELVINVPIFRHLPKLWAVAVGHLRFIGVSPLSPMECKARTEEWERIRDQAPSGLLGPSQLFLSLDVSAEERFLVEGEYAANRSLLRDLSLVVQGIKAFFYPSTWCSGGQVRKELG